MNIKDKRDENLAKTIDTLQRNMVKASFQKQFLILNLEQNIID